MAATKTFDQNAYWIARHARLEGDPRSVGNLGRSIEENQAAERRLQRWVGISAGVLRPYASVLDVGCGYGRVARVFCDAGYAYTGVDVSPKAIEAARRAEPRGTYIVGSALDARFSSRFDLITVLYVFVHFVDDAHWRGLIANLAAHLAPGGGLLFADNFPDAPDRPADHVALRPLAMYDAALAEHGIRFDPAFRGALAGALGVEEAKLPPAFLARKIA